MILSAGLSPAWQGTLVFDRVRLGEVNRAREARWCASGKVINVGRVLHALHRRRQETSGAQGQGNPERGGPSRLLSIRGGTAGSAMAEYLEREGLAVTWIQSGTVSRVCTTVIDSSTRVMTELVENAGPAAAAELSEFASAFARLAGEASMAILTGSLPGGAPEGYYRDLMSSAPCPVILDARGPELLRALELRPFLVKPNREELAKTVGRPIEGPEALREAMAEIALRGAQWVVVSQGPEALLAHGRGKFHRFRPPKVKPLNPIGSGDSLAAGIAHAVDLGADPIEAIRFGVACGSDNATTLLPGEIDPRRVEARVAEVTVEMI